jgi:uncharacterized protein (TIGR02722 family)
MKVLGVRILAALAAACLFGGCAAFRISVDERRPTEGAPLSAKYDQRDLLRWADVMAGDILTHPFPPKDEERPILACMGIQNRTRSHLDMKALSDSIGGRLLNSGKVRLVNVDRRDDLLREQGFQIANCTPEASVKIGKQLGARYMLTGSLIEIAGASGREVRVSRREDVYYQLTVEITDLETGLLVLQKQEDRLRRASKPLFGW